MTIIKLNTEVFIEIPEGADLEDVARDFDMGAEGALRGFPSGEIIQVDVNGGHVLTEAEIKEAGFDE